MPKEPSKEKYMAAVGQLVQNASFADAILFTAFKRISGCSLETAKDIYFALSSTFAKERMVTRVASHKCDSIEIKHIKVMIQSAKDTNQPRNELAHALLAETRDGELIRLAPRYPKLIVSQTDLDSRLHESEKALTEGRVAFLHFCKKRGVPQKLLY